MKIVSLKQKSQVTIPQEIVESMRLNVGDKMEVYVTDNQIVLKPVLVISKDQSWFFSKAWQEKEKQAEKDIQKGRIIKANSSNELLTELKKK
ncbi:MAG: AbrB/MazE/SpoVT family DNA-binding domain-containing protein [Caldisericia bacterium]|nr:AbrB/MazE/SpoVT family DNA-binding domain-containing protein [Caldisericia bacterium]